MNDNKILSYRIKSFLTDEQLTFLKDSYTYEIGDSFVEEENVNAEIKSVLNISILEDGNYISSIYLTSKSIKDSLYIDINSDLYNWPKTSIEIVTFAEIMQDPFINYLDIDDLNKLTYYNYCFGYVYKNQKYDTIYDHIINGNKIIVIKYDNKLPVIEGSILLEVDNDNKLHRSVSIYNDNLIRCMNCDSTIQLKYMKYIDTVMNKDEFNDSVYTNDELFVVLRCPLCGNDTAYPVTEYPHVIKIYNMDKHIHQLETRKSVINLSANVPSFDANINIDKSSIN